MTTRLACSIAPSLSSSSNVPPQGVGARTLRGARIHLHLPRRGREETGPRLCRVPENPSRRRGILSTSAVRPRRCLTVGPFWVVVHSSLDPTRGEVMRSSRAFAVVVGMVLLLLAALGSPAQAAIHEQVAAYCSGGGHGAISEAGFLEPPGITDPTEKNFAQPVLSNGVVEITASGPLVTDAPAAKYPAGLAPSPCQPLSTPAPTATRSSPRERERPGPPAPGQGVRALVRGC